MVAHWPDDVVPVAVDGGHRRHVLAADLASYDEAGPAPRVVGLLGPFDAQPQGRDRELLVPEPAAREDLWRPLGRPGAVLADHRRVAFAGRT